MTNELISIGVNDRNICTGCFNGSLFWSIDKNREENIPTWSEWLAKKLNTKSDEWLRENLKTEFEKKFNKNN